MQKSIWKIIGLMPIVLFSCKEENNDSCVAGNGGMVDLVLFPQHHLEPIIGIPGYVDSAFIKFNTSQFPGDNPSKYDLVLSGEVGSDSIVVKELKCGKYYLFMTGFDPSLAERVKGGIPFTISKDVVGRKPVIIPVTEDPI